MLPCTWAVWLGKIRDIDRSTYFFISPVYFFIFSTYFFVSPSYFFILFPTFLHFPHISPYISHIPSYFPHIWALLCMSCGTWKNSKPPSGRRGKIIGLGVTPEKKHGTCQYFEARIGTQSWKKVKLENEVSIETQQTTSVRSIGI